MPSVKEIDNLCINTIRFLAVDAVQKANSGHPGMPMGMAPLAYLLYTKYMKYNPSNPKWYDRDRFVLSAGHGSMLLYSMLHLTGHDLTLDDLKNFRQWESKTPGHPEYHLTAGVETTTGPLGQGFSNAVGMAVAGEYLAALFNKEDFTLLDNYIYVIASDGDMMEGISHEAASFAGHQKLGHLIVFYDDNGITIDGETKLAFSEDVGKRFEAYGWHVQRVDDVNDLSALEKAIENAKKETSRPSFIVTKTHIGYGSPNKQDKASSHGSPLGDEEAALAKKNLGWPSEEKFFIPSEVSEYFSVFKSKGKELEEQWVKMFVSYSEKYPAEARLFRALMNGDYGEEWKAALPVFKDDGKKIATRSASGNVLNAIADHLPGLIGGSADLAPSNNTNLKKYGTFSPEDRKGRNFHFGVREHGMGAIMNGMALYGGLIPYGGTFLVFSDYMRPAIRLASLSGIRPVFIFTHDSIGLGEDGPTHQPVEHIAALRAIPGVIVLRPADANETAHAWRVAIEHKIKPVAIALTRQNLPVLDQGKYASASNVEKGAYILLDTSGTPDVIILASGSEVHLAIESAKVLGAENIKARVVSVPSWELFEMQSKDYRNLVLPAEVTSRVAVEAGIKMGWEKFVGEKGAVISIDRFGASAPYEILMEKFGFNVENVVCTARDLVKGK